MRLTYRRVFNSKIHSQTLTKLSFIPQKTDTKYIKHTEARRKVQV